MKWNSYGLLPVLVLCMVYSCNSSNNSESDRITVNPDSVTVISGLGRIGSLDEITQVTPEISGVVEKVYHEPGDTLAEGDIIFSLKHKDEMIRKRQLEAELETAKTAIVLLEQQIETAEKTLETQKNFFKRLQNSSEAGAESQQNVDQ
ncbi:MAG: biotin/lipoyl-binding protein, partial [Bacteroidota bacterium]